jgi:hypothetical protein
MITFHEIYTELIRHQAAHPEQRRGQVLFNYLYANEQTRSFAEEIRGTNFDPFYVDSRCADVLAKLFVRMYDDENA